MFCFKEENSETFLNTSVKPTDFAVLARGSTSSLYTEGEASGRLSALSNQGNYYPPPPNLPLLSGESLFPGVGGKSCQVTGRPH